MYLQLPISALHYFSMGGMGEKIEMGRGGFIVDVTPYERVLLF